MRILASLLLFLALDLIACGGGTSTTSPATEPPAVESVEPTEVPVDGSGVITFGLAYDPDTLEIPKPIARFKRNLKRDIAWSAELVEPAGATSIKVVFARVGKGGTEELILSTDTELSNPDFTIVANAADLVTLAENRAGTYVLRYLRDATLLAEGQFQLIK
jgi:hypothetical protein